MDDYTLECLNDLQRQLDEAFGRIRYLEREVSRRADHRFRPAPWDDRPQSTLQVKLPEKKDT